MVIQSVLRSKCFLAHPALLPLHGQLRDVFLAAGNSGLVGGVHLVLVFTTDKRKLIRDSIQTYFTGGYNATLFQLQR
jgi:hypothetical protein